MKLSHYPYIVIRIECPTCKRSGRYRLARLADRFGAETSLDAVVHWLSLDCPWRGERRGECQVRLVDLGASGRPPDLPPAMMGLRVVKGGRE